MGNRVLVTGGTGYIGSHTVVELQNAGFEVYIIDSLYNSTIEVIDNIEKITGKRPIFHQFDLCDQAKLDSFFEKYGNIDAVIHFAAFKAVGESVQKPLLYYRNNLISLMNLLHSMARFSVHNLVFSSSCTVYGQPEKLPVTESAPIQNAESPYGNTKQISEEIISDTVKSQTELNAISLRYFNPVGAHKTALIGELPIGTPSNLVPFITQTAAGVQKELSVFGDDYNTPDGTCIRDFIYVGDLAKAHVVAIQRLINKKNSASYEFFNIGTGNGNSVMELILSFEKVTGIKLNYRIVKRRPGDIEKIYADTTLANNELGWKAETPLDETLLSAWNWEVHYRRL